MWATDSWGRAERQSILVVSLSKNVWSYMLLCILLCIFLSLPVTVCIQQNKWFGHSLHQASADPETGLYGHHHHKEGLC